MSKAESLRKQIQADLLAQLERNGTIGKHYTNLVDDYMAMWDIKNELHADIMDRGVIAEVMTGNGFTVQKRNESVDQLTRVNAQMLKLLSEIGIKPSQSGGDGDDEL